MTRTYERALIAKEVELGFLYIPSAAQKSFPKNSGPVRVRLGESSKPTTLTYNATHHRVFGLTKWYREAGAEPKRIVQIEELGNGAFRLQLREVAAGRDYTTEEAQEIIDFSGLSAAAKGNIIEDRIKEQILLMGQGLLNVYKPVSDIEGIDLIVVKRGVFQPIFLQIKGRFGLTSGKNFLCDIRIKTFRPHHTYFVVGAYFNPSELELHDSVILVPTETVAKQARKVKGKGDERYRIQTPLSQGSGNKWAPFICKKQDLAHLLLQKFKEIEQYYK